MKKLFTLLLTTLLTFATTAATELWTGPCTIGDWSGTEVKVDKSAFESAAAGNIIKVTFSAYAETDAQSAAVTYWQYSLKQKDNGWIDLTGFSGGNLTKGQKSASYTLTETNVTELKDYGLVVNGRYITVAKVELLTSSTQSLWTGSQATGDWSSNVVLTYNDKGALANAMMNDYIKMTYTVTAEGAQAAIQNADWGSFIGKDDNSYVAEGDNSGKTLTFTIEDATTLENIQQNGVLLRGKYITITACDLIKPDSRYDAVPLTIGSDGICSYGSSKNLDFSKIDGVTPYYVSSVESGLVHLTSVTTTRGWAGYIVEGTPGTYDVPVAATEPDWMDDFYYLRYSGDYNGNWVYRSAYSDYSGTDDNATKIKTYYRYIFAKESNGAPAFYKLATDYSRTKDEATVYYHELAAHKAYLETPTDITPASAGPAPAIHLIFEEENNATALDSSAEANRCVKVIQNGRLLIIKNGITYDLTGNVVR